MRRALTLAKRQGATMIVRRVIDSELGRAAGLRV
jgi:hypothetical protein